MNVLRSLLAIVVGYVIFAVSAVALFALSGRDPHAPQPVWFMIASTLFGMGFAATGGFVATRIASGHPLRHAAGVGLLLATGAVASLLTSPDADATWSQWGALVLMAPSACLAGRYPVRTRDSGTRGP